MTIQINPKYINGPLVTYLEKIQGSTVDILNNPGNAGDGIIACGLRTLLEYYNIETVTINYPNHSNGETLFVFGSGALCRTYCYAAEWLLFYIDIYQNIVILPCSIDANFWPVRRMLYKLPKNTIIFCRERISYDNTLNVIQDQSRVLLNHDLAFYNKITETQCNDASNILFAFRTDAESRMPFLPGQNFDLSKIGNETSGLLLIEILRPFDIIYTDRLHIAIAGSLLQKHVVMFPNNYHKLVAVYDFSLTDYPRTRLARPDDFKFLKSTKNIIIPIIFIKNTLRRFDIYHKFKWVIKNRNFQE